MAKILEVADGKADVRKLEYPALAYQMTGDKSMPKNQGNAA